jgi:hypothetical protein
MDTRFTALALAASAAKASVGAAIAASHVLSGDTGRHRVCRAADPTTLIRRNR